MVPLLSFTSIGESDATERLAVMEAQLNYANVCLHKANVCVIFKQLSLFFAITQKRRSFNLDVAFFKISF